MPSRTHIPIAHDYAMALLHLERIARAYLKGERAHVELAEQVAVLDGLLARDVLEMVESGELDQEIRHAQELEALTAENARLRAALEQIDLMTYSKMLDPREIERICREALTGRTDGEA